MDLSNLTYYFTLNRVGYFFYIVNPKKHSPKSVDNVMDYFNEVLPYAVLFMIVELVLDHWNGKPSHLQDVVANGAYFKFLQLTKMITKGSAVWTYSWVYNNYRLVDLPHDSLAVWIVGFFAADLNYYFIHRLTHQVNLFWSFHEIHHSSEQMVLSSTLRNHMFYFVTFWVIFNPFAFIIPTSINLVHYELGLVYQFWIHTEKIQKLPRFFEYVFNTPSHHRVHHARNRKYIDKNYGAVLIVWDRLFGTFEEEDPNDKPIFGLTKQMKTLNPLVAQTRPLYLMWKKVCASEGLKNKLSAIFKGPGWSPGTSWCGDLDNVPHPPEYMEKYEPNIPQWAKMYIFFHFAMDIILFIMLSLFHWALSLSTVKLVFCFVLYSTFVFGFLQDNSRYVAPFEIFRHMFFFFVLDAHMVTDVAHLIVLLKFFMFVIRTLFVFTALMWIKSVLNLKTRNSIFTEKVWNIAKNPLPEVWRENRLKYTTD